MERVEKTEMRHVIQTSAGEKIKKAVLENPDLPLIVFAGEYAWNMDYDVSLCTDITVEITDVLDCDQEINDEILFTDKSDFAQEIADYVFENLVEFDNEDVVTERVKEIMAKYEPYWKKCIVVTIG